MVPEQRPMPFGSHGFAYPAGTIRPSGAQADLDAAVARVYDGWKAAYVVAGCGGHYVRTGGGTGSSSAITVSEGHGYGMIAVAMMAGHDPEAQSIFDGFVRVFRAFPSSLNQGLMSWAIGPDCKAVNGPNSATDGDLDIAFALLLAHRQWGSGGAVDYLGEANRLIRAIESSEMNRHTHLPLLGDWAASASFYYATRPSDFMPDHFRAFATVSGRPKWKNAVESVYLLVSDIQQGFSPQAGLLPDFVIETELAPRPAAPNFLEGSKDGAYGWNSCRVPWRLGTDFIASGDERAKAALERINTWITAQTGGDPEKISAGYDLAGGALERWNSPAFIAPLGVAAVVDARHQAWLDPIWAWLVADDGGEYYADSIKLLSMLVISGNWWAP